MTVASDSNPSSEAALAALRQAMEGMTRSPEAECVRALLDDAQAFAGEAGRISDLAGRLAAGMRRARHRAGGVDALMCEFSLDSNEGVALMCLAEALLRVPDNDARLRLIRDKLRARDWSAHVGHSPSLFVNAAAWSLALTGRLLAPDEVPHVSGALARMASRGGEVLVREAMDLAMRLVGQQFVLGETIEAALERATTGAASAYRYSFDMLGEAAVTSDEAAHYAAAYAHAIQAIGSQDRWRGVHKGNGISIKLSALHPRYGWSQRSRVMHELVPRVRQLCLLAKRHDIGLTIDAEESERLDLSLDVLAALVADPALADWSGLGFVVQAYQKRAPALIDWLVGVALRHRRRLMVRLVKGAYWDTEIKRAQQDGLIDYPVYTRKVHTDVAYLACARRLLAAPGAVFPLFATHNAHTVASILEAAGPFRPGDYEFQCLHGMGEGLYRQLVAAEDPGLRRPVRVYAPVGSHRTLLAYLVRRLLENGANTSFVNRIGDDGVPLADLVADPLERVRASAGDPHPGIPLPENLYSPRRNSRGFDLAAAAVRRAFQAALARSREAYPEVGPRVAGIDPAGMPACVEIRNPACQADRVGGVRFAVPAEIQAALEAAGLAAADWGGSKVDHRALCLERAAQAFEARTHALVALVVREAGKTVPAALGEVREAVDYCRCYASRLRAGDLDGSTPLGVTVAISPWNFPLAIFVGQIAASLAAGNTVIAKPAEQTPLVADLAVALFHEAGVPRPVLQCLPGQGGVGAALVADERVRGVLFTGSTKVAAAIHRQLASRGNVPLVAETGGINAMIVDSTALPEQVVGDVLASAFDSAGQRCSALRLLCLQEEIADRVLSLLDGAMAELRIGLPDDFSTDVGPVIDLAARLRIDAYVDVMRANRHRILSRSLPDECAQGWFVAPTLIEIPSPDDLRQEVFGPVLHVVRYESASLDAVLDAIGAQGYGLTLGIQSRIDDFVQHVIGRMKVGNIYVNRSMIGAVVGVQPFGGEGLSGTGPKAGGPLLLRRLVRGAPPPLVDLPRPVRPLLATLASWVADDGAPLDATLRARLLGSIETYEQASLAGVSLPLPGPTGEVNTLTFHARGTVLGVADSPGGWLLQLAAAVATDNRLLLQEGDDVEAWLRSLPQALRAVVDAHPQALAQPCAAVLLDVPVAQPWRDALARREGPILLCLEPEPDYCLERLIVERCVSVNVTATGGNASLLQLGEV